MWTTDDEHSGTWETMHDLKRQTDYSSLLANYMTANVNQRHKLDDSNSSIGEFEIAYDDYIDSIADLYHAADEMDHDGIPFPGELFTDQDTQQTW